MKKVSLIFILSLFALTTLKAQTSGEPKLTWSDEFNGAAGAPDATKWDRPEYNRRNNNYGPDGWWSREDSFVDGKGNLVIRVRKIANKNSDTDAFDYSCGAIRTKGKFSQLYGRYEIRCQLPKQQGWWVAFWMMQGNVSSETNTFIDGAEVDIMEAFGWTSKINHAVHYDGYGAAHKSEGQSEFINGIQTGYHTYTLDWYPDKYLFFVDGTQVWNSRDNVILTGVCNQPGYIKVTGEISTESWAMNQWWANDPAKATYPDSFKVDYVRVYQFDTFTSANNLKPNNSIKVYPNPVDGFLSIDLPNNMSDIEKLDIQIVNLMGNVVKSFKQVDKPAGLSVSDLKHGLYFLTIQSGGDSFILKFMKN